MRGRRLNPGEDQPPSQNFMLQVQLYQAKDLPAADAQGSTILSQLFGAGAISERR